jgi:peptidoglycan/xylan/chitin deacetylase (PgdA/CDA1 family)
MGKPALSPADIRAMAAAGIEFGSHGRSHISLASAHLAPAVLEREIGGSKTALEESLGVPIPYFAYPYGTARDIDDRVIQAVRQAGYRLGCTSIHGTNLACTNPLLLRRVKVERADSLATFRELLRGGMDAWAVVDNYGTFLQSKRRTQPFAGADAAPPAR